MSDEINVTVVVNESPIQLQITEEPAIEVTLSPVAYPHPRALEAAVEAEGSADNAAASAAAAQASQDQIAQMIADFQTPVVDSMVGAEIDKAPSVSSVKAYIDAADIADIHYLGDPSTDGSWRFFNDTGTLKIQARVAGVWTTISEFTA